MSMAGVARLPRACLAWLAITGGWAGATERQLPRGHPEDADRRATLEARAEPGRENPFAHFRYTASDEPHATDLAACVALRLELVSATASEPLRGELKIENRCAESIAVLTAPVEYRARLTSETRFPAEEGTDRVYAIAYVFDRQIGLGKDAFRGDGGLTVRSLPDFVVVEAAARMAVPLSSGQPLKLAPGRYGLALFTVAVPAPGFPRKPGKLDLFQPVAQSQQTRPVGPPLVMRPTAVRLAPVAFFEITPAAGAGGS